MTTIYSPPGCGIFVPGYRCPYCGRCHNGDPAGLGFFLVLGVIVLLAALSGCVPSTDDHRVAHFESHELDSCLAIVVDLSGSFSANWDDRAYQLFVSLMDQFFSEGTGGEARIVIGQLSGSDEVVLFEGRPADLQAKFASPAALNDFLEEHSNPGGSPVYAATDRALDYVLSMPGVTGETRLLTVVLSDMADSEPDAAARRQSGHQMLATLKRYRERGGGLALYFVSPEEMPRWNRILDMAQFEPGSYVIESTLVAEPQLPQFD